MDKNLAPRFKTQLKINRLHAKTHQGKVAASVSSFLYNFNINLVFTYDLCLFFMFFIVFTYLLDWFHY